MSPLLSLRDKNTHTHTLDPVKLHIDHVSIVYVQQIPRVNPCIWWMMFICSTRCKFQNMVSQIEQTHVQHTFEQKSTSRRFEVEQNFPVSSFKTTHLHRNPGFFVYPKSRQLLYRSEPSSHNPQVMSIQLEDGDWLHK